MLGLGSPSTNRATMPCGIQVGGPTTKLPSDAFALCSTRSLAPPVLSISKRVPSTPVMRGSAATGRSPTLRLGKSLAGNVPSEKRERPARMFAGEGDAFRTNKRFHLLSEGQPATRLSTAFDSVTLYGFDPDLRPDIYGKVGNSGVSICTLDDMKVLYGGFDLCDPTTSVSMTINGPAPTILAMFLNTAIDQQLDRFIADNKRPPTDDEIAKIRAWTLATAGHNTVVIDGEQQSTKREVTDGVLRYFDVSAPDRQVVSASGESGYPGKARVYRRTIALRRRGPRRGFGDDGAQFFEQRQRLRGQRHDVLAAHLRFLRRHDPLGAGGCRQQPEDQGGTK